MTIGIDIDDTICSTNERIIIEADKTRNTNLIVSVFLISVLLYFS